ncbi:hypothetical protein UF75_4331 [Desulfosporosinus sp. I2]|nr:hypothetical protein UF75_4331 [Desulfosporosinus sp. I2]
MVAVGFPHPGKQRDDRVGFYPLTLFLPLAKADTLDRCRLGGFAKATYGRITNERLISSIWQLLAQWVSY